MVYLCSGKLNQHFLQMPLPRSVIYWISSKSEVEGRIWVNIYPDSNPGRGSLKVVVRELWSTKYRTPSAVYFISQPGGKGCSLIILQQGEGSEHDLSRRASSLGFNQHTTPPNPGQSNWTLRWPSSIPHHARMLFSSSEEACKAQSGALWGIGSVMTGVGAQINHIMQ